MTTPTKPELLRAILRKDLTSFIRKTFHTIRPGEVYMPNWHIEAIAWYLTQCYEGRIKRLIITIPPRHLKSIAASVAFPAWVLGQDPTRKILCVSYAEGLAERHAFDTRTVMEAEWYRYCFPRTRLHRHKNTRLEFATTRQGFRLATSVGGTLTGRGGNLIIIDDPHKPEEAASDTRRETVLEWYRNTLLSRLDSKRDDAIILIQQRVHEADLAGYLLESGDWVHLDIPAIAEESQRIPLGPERVHVRQPGDCLDPKREPRAVLDQTKAQMGSYVFAAQFQQRPAPLGGGIIQWGWFKFYEALPESADHNDLVIQSWDTATKAETLHDYSVCTTWLVRNNHCYLRDVYRARLEFPELKKRIVAHAEAWQAGQVLIEDKGAGTSLIQALQRETRLAITPRLPKEDKAIRAMGVTAQIEAGRILVPREALWLADFQREVVTFPNGKYDDQVDSLTQFLQWWQEHGYYYSKEWEEHLEAIMQLNEEIADNSPLREQFEWEYW